jgi:DNA polymerase
MTRINRVDGDGNIPCPIMLIGEAPGKSEDKNGRPFCGKSGLELDNVYLHQYADIDRRNVFTTNLVRCRTNDRDRDPTQKEIDACSHILLIELAEVKPRFIGLIGRLSTQWMFPGVKMEKVHGFGYQDGERLIMPLYHPAYGLHNTSMMRHIMEDFRRFGRMVRGDKGVM